MLYHPERVALAGLLVWIALFIVAPLQPTVTLSLSAMAFVAGCYAALLLGCFVPGTGFRGQGGVPVKIRPAFLWTVLGTGFAGISIRFLDRSLRGGLETSLTALEKRAALEEAQAGPLSVIGGALTPFCYVPLIILLTTRFTGDKKWAWTLSIVLFALPIIEALNLLSRASMLVGASLTLFAVACTKFRGSLLNRRLLPAAVLIILVGAFVSTALFETRLQQFSSDVSLSVQNSGYAHTLRVGPDARGMVENPQNALESIVGSMVPNLMYYVHGLFEFSLLWDRPDDASHSYGVLHFAPFAKALAIFTGSESITAFMGKDFFYREGIWTTFFGPLWVDFGWFSFVLMFFLGIAAKWISNGARSGDLAYLPLHLYFAVVLFFMPVLNLIVSAQGNYLIASFAVFAFAAKRWGLRKQKRQRLVRRKSHFSSLGRRPAEQGTPT